MVCCIAECFPFIQDHDESIAWLLAKQAFFLINKTGQLPVDLFDSPPKGASSPLQSRSKFSEDQSRQHASVVKLVPTTEPPTLAETVDSASLSPPGYEFLLPMFESSVPFQWKAKSFIAQSATRPPREPSECSPSVQRFNYEPHSYTGPRAIRSKRTTTTEAILQTSESKRPFLAHT